MKREVKFRGQLVDTKEWIFGDLIQLERDFKKVVQILDWSKIHNDQKKDLTVIPESVGQFTGFKDKNGNEIYEGQTVEEIINDKAEDLGFYRLQSKVEFAFGCWVVCEIGFDYVNSEFEDYTLLNDCAYCVSVIN